MLEVHRDCIGFASKRHEIGQHKGNLKPPQSQSDDRTKPNRDLVTRVLPRYRPVSCIDTDFSLASCEIIMKDFYHYLTAPNNTLEGRRGGRDFGQTSLCNLQFFSTGNFADAPEMASLLRKYFGIFEFILQYSKNTQSVDMTGRCKNKFGYTRSIDRSLPNVFLNELFTDSQHKQLGRSPCCFSC